MARVRCRCELNQSREAVGGSLKVPSLKVPSVVVGPRQRLLDAARVGSLANSSLQQRDSSIRITALEQLGPAMDPLEGSAWTTPRRAKWPPRGCAEVPAPQPRSGSRLRPGCAKSAVSDCPPTQPWCPRAHVARVGADLFATARRRSCRPHPRHAVRPAARSPPDLRWAARAQQRQPTARATGPR